MRDLILHVVAPIILVFGCFIGVLTNVSACKTETDSYASSCKQLWAESAGKTPMSHAYIVRCCEVVDGTDNPEEQSAVEGECMVKLLLPTVQKPKQEDTK